MEHYEYLILKGLIKGGGSSSESYTYRLLTGNVKDDTESVSRMWFYLDKPLQERLAVILSEICHVELNDTSTHETVLALIDHMSESKGSRDFHNANSRREIEVMSDSEYESRRKKAINDVKNMLLSKEK